MKRLTTLMCLVVGLALSSACADDFDPFEFMNPDFDEGLNLHDVTGTVRISSSVATVPADVGMIYIGLYAATDDTVGYPLPVVAPGTGDAFPYGGTTIGSFEARDPVTGERDTNLVCAQVLNREFLTEPGSGDLLHTFTIKQFPFYPGATVWAFVDQDYSTCDGNLGVSDPDDPNITFGSNLPDVLNKPQNYIVNGHLVTDNGGTFVMNNLDHFEIRINCTVGAGCIQ